MTRQLISWKNGWQLVALAGALQWGAAGCSSDASNIGIGTGGSDGGADSGMGGRLGGTRGRGTGGHMAGATLPARVRLGSGLITGPTDRGQAFIALKTTASYVYAAGPDITLDPTAGWKTITANADAPSASLFPGYTSCDVREIDVVIQ